MTGLSKIPAKLLGTCRCDGLLLMLVPIVPTILATVLSMSHSKTG